MVLLVILSVMLFRNPITPLNGLGIGLATLGFFIYSYDQQRIKQKVSTPRHHLIPASENRGAYDYSDLVVENALTLF